jgi:uncharacterized membrane protein YdjX (TVP38/TMEM64 family)
VNGQKGNNYGILTLIFILIITLIVCFFYFDRQNQLSQVIRSWGPGGILLSILLMTAICITPIPSEGLVILLLKVFGIYEGPLYSWLGSILGSLVIFFLARHFGQVFFRKMITPQRFEMIDHWIQKKGSTGLLVARLLPIPAFAVNYITALMPSVKLWPYIWTSALSMIPYYLWTALLYVGIAKSIRTALIIGGVAIIIFWGINLTLSNKSQKHLTVNTNLRK